MKNTIVRTEEDMEYKENLLLDSLIKFASTMTLGFSWLSAKKACEILRRAAAYIELHEEINTK